MRRLEQAIGEYWQAFVAMMRSMRRNRLVVLIALGISTVWAIGVVGWQHFNQASQNPVLLAGSQKVLEAAEDKQKEEDESSELIWIDVSGSVVWPGLRQVPTGSRIAQVLEMAGGLQESADSEYVYQVLNLAMPMEDGDKLYIPSREQVLASRPTPVPLVTKAGSVVPLLSKVDEFPLATENSSQLAESDKTDNSAQSSQKSLINVNNVSEMVLDDLPGVGPATAAKIVANRPYKDLTELCKVINNSRTCNGLEELVEF